MGVDKALDKGRKESGQLGAGDQDRVWLCCNETDELMPMPIILAHKLAKGWPRSKRGSFALFKPDGKSQATIEYEDGSQ